MNLKKTLIASVAALACVFGASAALADRGHDHGHGDHWHGGGGRWDGHGWRSGSDWHLNFYYVRPRFGPAYRFEWDSWRGGRWYHSWHNGVYGWWWVIGDDWFDYPAPIYPYPVPSYYYYDPVYSEPVPNEYYPPAPAAGAYPASPPVTSAPPPQQSWYYCSSPKGYSPYISSCPGGWRAVPATPPGTIRGQ